MIAYYNGKFLTKDEIRISPDDRGFLFADGAYEVMHSYYGEIFRLDDHLQRFERSLRELKIFYKKVSSLGDIAIKLLQKNDLLNDEALIYYQITRGIALRDHHFPASSVPVTVFGSVSKFLPYTQKCTDGVKLITFPDIRWHRCDIKSIALTPNVLAIQHAKDHGVDDSLFVRDTFITETSRASFFTVIDGIVQTHPSNNLILGGITRKVILELCNSLHIPYKEYPLPVDELKNVTEAFQCGTGSEIFPVIQIDDLTIGKGKPGNITKKIQQAFYDLTHNQS